MNKEIDELAASLLAYGQQLQDLRITSDEISKQLQSNFSQMGVVKARDWRDLTEVEVDEHRSKLTERIMRTRRLIETMEPIKDLHLYVQASSLTEPVQVIKEGSTWTLMSPELPVDAVSAVDLQWLQAKLHKHLTGDSGVSTPRSRRVNTKAGKIVALRRVPAVHSALSRQRYPQGVVTAGGFIGGISALQVELMPVQLGGVVLVVAALMSVRHMPHDAIRPSAAQALSAGSGGGSPAITAERINTALPAATKTSVLALRTHLQAMSEEPNSLLSEQIDLCTQRLDESVAAFTRLRLRTPEARRMAEEELGSQLLLISAEVTRLMRACDQLDLNRQREHGAYLRDVLGHSDLTLEEN